MFLQPEPEPILQTRTLVTHPWKLPHAACEPARRSLQPLRLVEPQKGLLGFDPIGNWPLASLQFPGAGGENETLSVDFLNLMIEY